MVHCQMEFENRLLRTPIASSAAVQEFFNQRLVDMGEAYKANQVKIQISTVSAWISFADGKDQEALQLMEDAVNIEYNTAKHAVTPGEVLPAGELLGDLLMEMGNPAKALEAYESDLRQHPNRFNGLYGAAIAAKVIQDDQKARKYFELLLLNTKNSSKDRKEILEAKEFIDKKIIVL